MQREWRQECYDGAGPHAGPPTLRSSSTPAALLTAAAASASSSAEPPDAMSSFENDLKKQILGRPKAEKVFRPWWDTLEDYLLNSLVLLGELL